MARRSPRVVDTKEKILEAALVLFGARGFHGVTIDEIATRAGVTKGAVYYYFKDTSDLARDLARQVLERLNAGARQALDPADDTVTSLKRGFDAFLAHLHDLPEARFFLRDCRAIPEVSVDRDAGLLGSIALIRAMLQRGVARGDIVPCDADALAHVLIGACAEAILHVLESGRSAATVEILHRLFDSLAARPARAQRPPRTKASAAAPTAAPALPRRGAASAAGTAGSGGAARRGTAATAGTKAAARRGSAGTVRTGRRTRGTAR